MTTIPCILIPFLVGLICALLGYLLGRLNSKNNKSETSNNFQLDYENCKKNNADLKIRVSQLEQELVLCKQNLNTSIGTNNLSKISNETVVIAPEIPFNTDLAASVFGKKIKQDDLKIIEGIGPKIEELYHAFGIKTWKQLSETSVEKSHEILASGGDRFKLHNPNTWAKQAKLCYEGKWEELKKWQDELDGGRE